MSRTTFILFAAYVVGGTLIWSAFGQIFTDFLIVCVGGIPLALVRAYADKL